VYGSNTVVNQDLVDRVATDKVGKLCIHRNGQPFKQRRYNVITQFGLDHNLGVYNNNVDAISRALTERYFFCADKKNGGFRNVYTPRVGAFNNTHFKNFRENVMMNMPNLPRLSRQQVVDRYTGSKRLVYQTAMESLSRERLHERDAYLKMFVKFEKQDLGKAPRGINPRDPRYNLELGRYLKHAEKPFFEAINAAFASVSTHTVIKGLNAVDSARAIHSKWNRFRNPVALGMDAEKFDAHVSSSALEFEHSHYLALFPGAKQLQQLLRWQIRNKGVAYADDGKVKFEVRGTRSSGDLNTSLGNCLIMCGAIYAYARQKQITVELANNGDDCVVFMEREDLHKFMAGVTSWFRDRGFSMVCEQPVYEFERVEFCQTHPVCVDGVWRMVRNHEAVLKKDPICLIAIQNQLVYSKWLYAVGIGGRILSDGVPVQEALYTTFYDHGTRCTQAMFEHIHKNSSMLTRIKGLALNQESIIAPSTRVSYYYAFGVLPDHQIEIEKYYKNMKIQQWEEQAVERGHLNNLPGLKLLENEISW